MTTLSLSGPALLGGEKAVSDPTPEVFQWPVIGPEDEAAVLEVLRRGGMSGTDVTKQFEAEFATWIGRDHALGCSSGTASLQSAMFGCGLGVGDELICQSTTFWASALQCFSLGATVVFADVDPDTLCIDPDDIERHVSPRTKAIMVVHYTGYPADMDRILPIARKHGLRVIEDVSHAQGSLYKGRKVGTFGDVAAMSLMSGKSFAVGEAGILVTDNREIYDRAVAFGHYERYTADISTESLRPFWGLPLGGYKYRMNQLCSALGRVQLEAYERRIREIQDAMNRFWDLLEDVPGLRAHRPPKASGSTMGGWYSPRGLYRPEELGGLSVTRFAQAVRAEGSTCSPGINKPLHLHPLVNTCDVYGHGVPTRLAHSDRDLRQPPGSLPVAEAIDFHTYTIPWFKHDAPDVIACHANAFRKTAEHADKLLKDDPGNGPGLGGWLSQQHG
ncbi:MAG: DegT/DnrJ/EryC1/StrS family aminotransferase [candidate division Zixibacteria bacterium]|nr:DegT/DnrJ/EryC1/StrS family aminotransferase [candidate division Zixibacteria bacterium]